MITIWVEEVKDRFGITPGDVMFGFYMTEIVYEIFKVNLSIFINIIGIFPELFDVIIANFGSVDNS